MSIDKSRRPEAVELSSEELELLAYLFDEDEQAISAKPTSALRQTVERLPLSFGQERLWFLDQWEPGNPAYNIPFAMRLQGRLNAATLEWSLNEVMRRHEVLRTTFAQVDGQPFQVIAPKLTVPITQIDLRGLAKEDQQARICLLGEELSMHLFSLERGPLLKATLARLAEEEWVFFLTIHHIIFDGWSIGILTREMMTCYEADLASRPIELPALPIQYADYALWQRQHAQTELLDQHLAYWREQLAGLPVLNLQTDYPRPAIRTIRGATVPVHIETHLSKHLSQLSQDVGCTLFMTLLAAFQVLLMRYSNQHDIAVGSPIAGRLQSETEHLIGFFVNTLVLRTDLSGNPRFRALLDRVRKGALEAYAHQAVPFERLVEELQPERNLSHTPLVQVMFALQNFGPETLSGARLNVSPLLFESKVAKFDLMLTLTDQTDGLHGELEYSTDLFTPQTIERMIDHFQTLLKAIVADPAQRILALPLLSPSEHAEQIRRWSQAYQAFPVAECLHTRFEQHALRTPDAIAAVYEGEQIPYGTLNARANQLAHHLRMLGVGPETLVGFYLERSLDLAVAVLGIHKAGGAYVPLDPSYPAERIAFILDDSRITVLLTQHRLVAQLPEHQSRLICLDTDWDQLARHSTDNPAATVGPDHLAYVIYTSGSTGQPKGSLITHAHVIRLFTATHQWFHFDQDDVWTLFHSIAFDFSVWELWGALLYGGRLVIVPHLTSRAPDAFAALLRTERVTVLNQTPSAFRQLIPADLALDGSFPPSALRFVIFGGERLDPQVLHPWFERYGDACPRLVNMYGITETTVHVTYRVLQMCDSTASARSMIGQPIPDLRLYILDATGQPVPSGLIGELYVGGTGVARGYSNRPALTAERFVPDPFSQRHGERLYRSGDLARETFDGDIEYLGRIDHQIKIRGFRIELGEITAVLQQHPEIREAITLIDEAANQPRLIAYIIPKADLSPSTSALRTFLKTWLPEYMIPSAFVPLAALPLTPNGKLDRRALPAPDPARPNLDEQFVPPSTLVEQTLAGIWAEVLGLQRVGIQDNFFALGGDSIRSVKVLALARQRGLELSLQHLFQHQTIADLAAHTQPTRTEPTPPLVERFALISAEDYARLPAGVEDAYPLTTLQSGMLFHSAAQAEQGIYHDVTSTHLRGRLDLALLRTAIEQVVHRHAILRTSFDIVSYSVPLQIVHQSVTISLDITDLRSLPPDAVGVVIDEWVKTEPFRSFQWDQPPLLRFHVHRRTDDTFQFSINFHHAILDGWSLASLCTELFQRYITLLNDPDAPMSPHPDVGFRDYVALELAALESEQHRAYWLDRLQDSPATCLPRSPHADADTQTSSEFIRYEVPIPLAVSQGLHQLTRRAGVPIKSVLLAAHLRVLAALSGSLDVLTGVVVHGRPQAASSEQVLGLFLNTVPFRLNLSRGTWLDLVRATFAAETEMQPFIRYPMARMQQLVGSSSLFEPVFNFTHFHVLHQIAHIPDIEMLDGSWFARNNFSFTADFNLDLNTNTVILDLDCNLHGSGADQIARIAACYTTVLEAMATMPDQPHHTFSLLSTEEYDQIVVAWNRTENAALAANEHLVHDLFAAQVQRTPDHLAVVGQDEAITYAELDRRADDLARYLRYRGVGPETVVGIFVEHSIHMVVALLGVWKAGAAYVPLDPGLPQDRIRYILTDTRAAILLTMASLITALPQTTVSMVDLDGGWDEPPPFADHAPPAIYPDQLAYVMYTSGSTGKPKGVMVTHKGLANYVQWASAAYQVAEGQGAPVHSPLGFDLTVTSLLTPLLCGRSVHLLAEETRLEAITAALSAHPDYSLVKLTPAHLDLLRHTLDPATLSGQTRAFVIGGEALRSDTIDFWRTNAPATRLINEYGPTETVVGCCVYDVSPDALLKERVPIGRPIANMQLYILDSQLLPVPLGVIGEVYIGGIQLARGYLNRADLTAARFVPHPFHSIPGARLYRTGDLARYLPDGNIEYLGRTDDQVKVRGYRIELGEIEAVLREQPRVQNAAVVLREDTPPAGGHPDKRIIAYVVPRDKLDAVDSEAQAAFIEQLHRVLKDRLASYMVPSAVVCLAALPLTTSGKLDRRALPTPEQERRLGDQPFVAPRDGLELHLTRIWEEVLHTQIVGINDDFFALGGHSLVAIRLMAQIRHQIGVMLPLSTLLKGATVAQVAAAIRQQRDGAQIDPLIPIQVSGSRSPFFCIHPSGGDVLCYRDLAAHLGDDQPFYGLQAVGLYGEQAPDTTIEAMATRYFAAIQERQPEGPYYLGGWSMGGVIAFEVARQIQEQGQEIAALVVIDSNPDSSTNATPETDLDLLAEFAQQIGLTLDQIAFLKDTVTGQDLEADLADALDQLQQAHVLPADLTADQFSDRFRVFRAHMEAARRYQPRSLQGPITVFQSHHGSERGDLATAWAPLVDSMACHTTPGTHYTMIRDPYVAELACLLTDCLVRTQTERADSQTT